MVRVKVCGITNIIDAENAVLFGADALGFVFAGSPRKISKEDARSIIEKLPPFITCVGLFVNEDVEKVKETCQFCRIHTIQFHGNETQPYLDKFSDFKLIKAIRIRDRSDLYQLGDFHADAYLLDSYSKEKMGGTGTTFDWKLAENLAVSRDDYVKSKRIIIAGGLNPENVVNAIQIIKPFGVDVSSGIEKLPGIKDKELMRRFILNAKAVYGEIEASSHRHSNASD